MYMINKIIIETTLFRLYDVTRSLWRHLKLNWYHTRYFEDDYNKKPDENVGTNFVSTTATWTTFVVSLYVVAQIGRTAMSFDVSVLYKNRY